MLYIIVGLFILMLALHYNRLPFNKEQQDLYLFVLLIVILIPALRYRVGGDTISYMNEYGDMPSLSELKSYKFYVYSRYQPLWIVFVAFLKSISPSFVLFQIAHAIIVNITVFSTIKKYSLNPFWGVFLYFIYAFFLFNFEILREAIAICVCAWSFKYCIDPKIKFRWVKYYVLAFVAYFIHDSAIVLLIVPLLYNRKISKTFIFICLLIGVVFAYMSESFIYGILSFGLVSYIPINVSDHAAYYLAGNQGFSPLAILYYLTIYLIFPLFVFYLGKKISLRTPVDGFLAFYIFLGLVASFIPSLYRLANYQIILSIIYLSSFIKVISLRIPSNVLYKNRAVLLFVIFLAVFTYRVAMYQFMDYSAYYPGAKKYMLFTPYYSVFNPEEYYPREVLINDMFYR